MINYSIIRLWIRILFIILSVQLTAKNITITNTNDSGPGSLRQAISDLNIVGPGPHTITFSPSLRGRTIKLVTSLPQITVSDVTINGDINGNGKGDIIIDAGTGKNEISVFRANSEASNTTIKGFVIQDTGLEPFLFEGSPSGITIQDIIAKHNDGNFLNTGIRYTGDADSLTVRNFAMSQGKEGSIGIDIKGVASGVIIDGFNYSNSGGVNSIGIKFRNETYNVTIKNSNINLNSTKEDDGDHGIYFTNAADNVFIENVTIHDPETYGIRFQNVTNSHIKNSTFDNFNGGGKLHMIRFDGFAEIFEIESNKINLDQKSTKDDASYGIVFMKGTTEVKISKNTINAADEDGIYIAGSTSNMTIDGNTITESGEGGNGDGIEFYNEVERSSVVISNNIIDNGGKGRAGLVVKIANRISEFKITGNKISNTTKRGIWLANGRPGIREKVLITKNTIFNNKVSGVFIGMGSKQIKISQNNLYNNGVGIEIDNGANCNYQLSKKKTPTLISSEVTGEKTFKITLTLPAICAQKDCDVDIYVNKTNDSGDNGRTYLQTFKNLPRGRQSINLTCEDKSCIDTPKGFLTATLTRRGSCGTSEFGNSLAISSQGPVCISSGVSFWLRADDTNQYGVKKSGWKDYSGNGANFDEVFGEPKLIKGNAESNYNPYIEFNGKDYFRPKAGAINKSIKAGEVICVGKTNSAKSKSGPMFYFGGSGEGAHYTRGNGVLYEVFGTTDRLGVNPSTGETPDKKTGLTWGGKDINVEKWNIYGVHSKSKNWGISFNGKRYSSKINTPDFKHAAKKEYVAAYPGSIFKGKISEIILFKRILTNVERLKINSYLALKYGLTLDQTKPTNYIASDSITTMWKAKDNIGFDNDIAGIGKDLGAACDNMTNLHQTISKSTNKGALVTIAVGSGVDIEKVDNSTNQSANPISKDLSFLTWGNNSKSTSFNKAAKAKHANVRMDRIWKVDKTKFVDKTLTINLAGGNPNMYLLVSKVDTTFTKIDQELKLNDKGSVTINSQKIPDGAYFTFGSKVVGPVCISPGISFWLRADDKNNNAANWIDNSGKGNNFNQANQANQPTLKPKSFNFNPSYRFDKQDRLTLSKSSVEIVKNTIIIVNRPDSITKKQSLIRFGELKSKAYASINHNNDQTQYKEIKSSDSLVVSHPGLKASGSYIEGVIMDNDVDGAKIFRNSTINNVTGVSNFKASNTPIYIGGEKGFDGLISEIIMYDRLLEAEELQRVYSYLAIKYGITLDQSTPTNYIASDGTTIIWDAAINTGYSTDIAGIGKDTAAKCDGISLHQTVSKSVNPDALVTIAVGKNIAIAKANNIANRFQNPILKNNAFLVWGHNNKANTFGITVKGAKATTRMNRVWKVDKTNFSDQIITINLSGGNSSNYILFSTSPTFETIDKEFSLNAQGSTEVNSLDIKDGMYFTFGKSYKGPACVTTGIKLWLQADRGGVNWNDQSGNKTVLTKKGNPKVGDKVNFNSSIALATTDYYNVSTGMDTKDDLMFFAVFQDYKKHLIEVNSINSEGKKIAAWIEAEGKSSFSSNAANQLQTVEHGTTIEEKTPYIISVSSKNAAVNSTIAINGKSKTGSVTITSGKNINIGSDEAENLGSGLISEIAVFNKLISDTDKKKIESYLAFKYGITLDQSSPRDYLASDGTTTMWSSKTENATTFNKDIFGIGRDDCTALSQIKSKSANKDGVVILLIEGESITNDNNSTKTAYKDLDDKEFLSISNNDGKAEWTTTGSPANFQVLNRQWSIQETGEVGTIQLDFHVSNPNFDIPDLLAGSKYYILYDSNNDGNLNDETPKPLVDKGGDFWRITGIDINTNTKFTLATEVSP